MVVWQATPHLYAQAYCGFGFGGGLGMPVVSYAPLPMLVIFDDSLTAIVLVVCVFVCAMCL